MKIVNVKTIATVALSVAISACSFNSESLFSSNKNSDLGRNQTPPQLGTTVFEPIKITNGGETGTFVGQKVVAFRGELKQLQETITVRNDELQRIRNVISEDTSKYHKIVAEIRSKLQMGTTHGNPILFAKWQNAQAALQGMNTSLISMNRLSTQVASDSAMTSYLLDSIRAAFNISGAIDEDHKHLNILEDETSKSSVLIERLSKELNQDITRQQKYIESEKDSLNILSQAIKNGNLFEKKENVTEAQPVKAAEKANYTSRPLFVIRFNKPEIQYEQGLYHATRKVLEAKPDAAFEIVAVSPISGNYSNGLTARKNAEAVLKSLISMGMPAGRVSLSSKSSAESKYPEVHLYIK